jgi:hypothetical protein
MSMLTRFALYFAVIAAIFTLSESARSQARPSPKTQVFSIDPVGLILDDPLILQYEYKTGPVNSWAFRALWWPVGVDGNYDWSAFGVGGAYRFYIADSRALTGLNIAPAAEMLFFHGSFANGVGSTKSGIAVWIGGDMGYKWIFDDFSVEPMIGMRIGLGPSSGDPTKAAVPTKATGFNSNQVVIGLFGGYAM